MKPFNLERAKAGDFIVDRSGKPVKFIAHIPEANHENLRVVFINLQGEVFFTSVKGESYSIFQNVFMAPKKRTVWVNLYPAGSAAYFKSKEEADRFAEMHTRVMVKAFPLEIEE